MATIPPVSGWWDTRRNPAASISPREGAGRREAADRFDEVAVGFGVARDGPAERGNDAERIGVVEGVEAGHVGLGEFQAQEAAARLEDPARLRQRRRDPGHVADAEGDRVGVEGAVREGQRLRVALDPVDAALVASGGPLAPDGQHRPVDVENGDAGLRPAGVQHAKGHVPGAAGDVESVEGPGSRRVQAGDEGVLPGPVQPAGHQVVHEVVAARHGAEDLVRPGPACRGAARSGRRNG